MSIRPAVFLDRDGTLEGAGGSGLSSGALRPL